MSQTDEKNHLHSDQAPIPEAVVERRRTLSIVWIVPLAALLIGGWLAYKAVSEKGPTITIVFHSAEGLEAGKTKIKYKEVEIGKVESIALSEDLSHVNVTAELVRGAESYLREDTRFWVVRARVAAGEVSGLGTLFSGAYIGMAPGNSGASARSFDGLETPPVLTSDRPGSHFTLHSESLGSVEVGSPVYFRQINVGQVVSYELDADGGGITLKIFVKAPHHRRVASTTRFWKASGIDFSLNASGLQVHTESLVTILAGGIAFDTPPTLAPGEPCGEDHIFNLYEDRKSTAEATYATKVPFLLYFDQSVRGLSAGSPVEFRGIRIGQVTEVHLEFDPVSESFRIPVLIEIEPQRFLSSEAPDADRIRILKNLVLKGLRAQPKVGNLLTGQCLVDLDLHPEAPPAQLILTGPYPQIPTIQTPIEELAAILTRLAKQVDQIPIKEIVLELRQTIATLDATLQRADTLMAGADRELTPSLAATLAELQSTLAEMRGALGADAPLHHETRQAMTELAKAGRSLRILTDYLQRHPESLLHGKGDAP